MRPPPDVRAALQGDSSSASYTLSDMAGDVVGLLDALGLDSAHLVGASMGGMIAQTLAIEHPERVRSLTSIMSSTGDPSVGQATRAGDGGAAVAPGHDARGGDRADGVDRARHRLTGIRPRRGRAALAHGASPTTASNDPVGVARQLVAIAASGDRTAALRSVSVPTLVVHGADDPLVDVSGGRATAAAIPGAELIVFDGMGHNLPRELWAEIARRIGELVGRAEAGRGVRPR